MCTSKFNLAESLLVCRREKKVRNDFFPFISFVKTVLNVTSNVNCSVLQVNDFMLLSLGVNVACCVVSCLEVSLKLTLALFSQLRVRVIKSSLANGILLGKHD